MARTGRPPLGPAREGADSAQLSPEEERALAAAVARAYYLDDESKVKIAERLSISRFQVARLLQVARKTGIVHIEIRPADTVDHDLSARLQAALGLDRAIVVATSVNAEPLDEIGGAVAALLQEVVHADAIVGLTWSRALVAMTQHLTRLNRCTLVQLAGHAGGRVELPGGAEVIRRAAEIAGGAAFPIYAPLVLPDARVAQSLLNEPEIAAAVRLFDSLDVAAISIGAWLPDESTVYTALSPEDRELGVSLGAVGEVSGRLFDVAGQPVVGVIDDRVIAVGIDQLRRTPEVIATGFGTLRAEATIAAAGGGLFRTLIADRSLAVAVLDRLPGASAPTGR